jgi:hypothetical protein
MVEQECGAIARIFSRIITRPTHVEISARKLIDISQCRPLHNRPPRLTAEICMCRHESCRSCHALFMVARRGPEGYYFEAMRDMRGYAE